MCMSLLYTIVHRRINRRARHPVQPSQSTTKTTNSLNPCSAATATAAAARMVITARAAMLARY